MLQGSSALVVYYRWAVFLLALGYWLYLFTITSLDAFGWQFRFLTNWGLTFYLLVAWLMLRLSHGKSDKSYNPLVSATVVLGAIVLFMYWKLFFIDPALVNSGGPSVWYLEYYLHGVGPALLMFDAFFILGVFRQIWATLILMLAVFLSYIAWIEFLVMPRNSTPVGDVTNGLPYPFLNDMMLNDRLAFYATTTGTALVFLGIGWVISKILVRIR